MAVTLPLGARARQPVLHLPAGQGCALRVVRLCLLLVVAGVAATAAGCGAAAAPAAPGTERHRRAQPALPVPSSATTTPWSVASENRKPGNKDWPITNAATDHEIEAFADRTSVVQGGSVGLYVSTKAAGYVVRAYRMGWYGGAEARQVWTSVPQAASGSCRHRPDRIRCSSGCRSRSGRLRAEVARAPAGAATRIRKVRDPLHAVAEGQTTVGAGQQHSGSPSRAAVSRGTLTRDSFGTTHWLAERFLVTRVNLPGTARVAVTS